MSTITKELNIVEIVNYILVFNGRYALLFIFLAIINYVRE